jgi:phage terminase large subunit-like protein
VVQSWDPASKGEEMRDFSVCTTWLTRRKEYYTGPQKFELVEGV